MVLTKSQEIDIKNVAKTVIQECFSDKVFMEAITSRIAELVMEKIQPKITELNEKCNDLETRVMELEEKNNMLEDRLDRLEQQNLGHTLRIYGVKEESSENVKLVITQLLKEKLKIESEESDIKIAYRAGVTGVVNENSKGMRPIIIKFATECIFDRVLENKKQFKNTKMYIAEQLTKRRLNIFNMAKEKLGPKNVWIWKGNVFTRKNNKKVLIKNKQDM